MQAIIRHRNSVSLTFINPPSAETKAILAQYGFQYDPKSGNWFKSQRESALIDEKDVAGNLAG
ncbi:MAG: hypothetical protein SGI88_03580 [Candidatus Hydrogenedentes bacterium]|nr:hypothetical protein [Candidatus Hydrogenedentota bacterium]